MGAQGVVRAVTIVQGLVLARMLGREDLGRYAVFASALALGAIVAQAGVPSALSRFIALAEDKKRQKEIRDSAATVAILWSLVVGASLALPPLGRALSNESWVWGVLPLALIILPLQTASQSNLAWLHGRAVLQRKSALESLAALISIVAIIGGAVGMGVSGAAWGRVVAAGCIAVMIGRVTGQRPSAKKICPDGFWRFALLSLASSSFSTMIHTADTLVLAMFRIGSGIIGDYRVAAMAYLGLSMVPAAAMHTMFPRLVRIHRDGGDLAALCRRLGMRLLAYGLIVGIMGVVFLPRLLVSILGAQYDGSRSFLLILSMGLPFRALVLGAGSVILALGRPGLNFSLLLLSGTLNIALNVLLISSIGAVGAAWATLATEATSAIAGSVAVLVILRRSLHAG